ncbi:MAG: glycine--tRNA ligase subunit beta, partial [Magnetococcales bacterium]|nr:glycine--tRNA ligase subunit beta [Magnetococcales bacterium]
MSNLLWEIGCEEIPSRMLTEAITNLEGMIKSALEQSGLGNAEIAWCHGTPRRLAVAVTGLAARQADTSEVRRGPPLERAFDAQGNPTKAAEG